MTWFILTYALLVLGALSGAMAWLKRRRRPKLPFKPERDKLLRGPGESLRRRIEELDEELSYLALALLALPLITGLLVLHGARHGAGLPEVWAVAAAAAATFGTLWAGAVFVGRKALRRGNHYLGWFGERLTAEELEPLREKGWKIYHDVPIDRGGFECNIDHVAIGPGGVFAIETKMRRKGHARPGRKDHEVIAEGTRLSWPWAEDNYGLPQAEANARDLRAWLEQLTGIHMQVTGVLTFPGWYVVERTLGPVRVVNVSLVPALLTARSGVLTDKQIDICARQLEARCRDVEY